MSGMVGLRQKCSLMIFHKVSFQLHLRKKYIWKQQIFSILLLSCTYFAKTFVKINIFAKTNIFRKSWEKQIFKQNCAKVLNVIKIFVVIVLFSHFSRIFSSFAYIFRKQFSRKWKYSFLPEMGLLLIAAEISWCALANRLGYAEWNRASLRIYKADLCCPYSVSIISLWRRVNKKLDEDPSTSHDFVTLVGLVSYYGAD